MSPLGCAIVTVLALAVVALAMLIAIFPRERLPSVRVIILRGPENTMPPVSNSIAAFVEELETRVPAAIAAAVAQAQKDAEPAIQKRIDAAVATATAAVVQDDTDGAAALEAALDQVAPVAGS